MKLLKAGLFFYFLLSLCVVIGQQEKDSKLVSKYLKKGEKLLKKKKYLEAKEKIISAYNILPENPEVNFLLAMDYYKLKEFKNAVFHFEQTFIYKPNHHKNLVFFLADAYYKNGQLEQAKLYFLKYLKKEKISGSQIELTKNKIYLLSQQLSNSHTSNKSTSKLPLIRFKNFYHEKNNSPLNHTQEELLIDLAEYLKAYPNVRVTVITHTDANCSEKKCLKLSKKRSQNIKQFLVSYGIKSKRVTPHSEGKNHLISLDKETELNRRTEFWLSYL